jgi:tRNA(Ile)-lysidine synthetase-like protein
MDIIYNFWETNTQLWFNSKPEDDKYIYDNFNHYLLLKYDINNLNKKEWTSYCILYDQLLRHINRHNKYNNNCIYSDINNIHDYYINYNKFKNELTDFEFMFQLMPIRHTHNMKHIKFVLNETWDRLEKNPNNNNIKKYLVATYERYIKCTPNMDKENLTLYEPYKSINPFSYFEILDKKCSYQNERFMPKLLSDCPLIINMKNFLIKHNLNKKIITISISGGVDSMVCSYLLYCIGQPFIAVHIDYYNRDECLKEESLLIWWCNIINIPLYIRRIDEINRPKCMKYELRDLYESYTKNIRFNSYITSNELNEIYIMLGHNKDDTLENVFTNIASNSHYDNLLGMEPISKQIHNNKEITIIRPLLTIYKSEIYEFALNHHIPFLVDSTPKWSQRGKIRDIVRPALEEWNPLILNGLMVLSDKMSQMTQLLNQLVDIDKKYNSIHDVPINETYWTILLKKMKICITQKTLDCLITKIKFLQLNEHKLKDPQKLTLSKNHFIIFKQDKQLIYIDIRSTK